MNHINVENILDDLLTNNKGISFLNHLIRAYYPGGSTTKVLDKPEGEFKCSLSEDNLISVNEVLNEINSEEYRKTFLDNLKDSLNGKELVTTDKLQNVSIGLKGRKTNTYLSYKSYTVLINWVMTKIMQNDKHIMWLLKDEMSKTSKSKEKRVNKVRRKDGNKSIKKSTYTLGDLGVLKKLKKK